jgi:hypothetical protein
MRLGRLPHDVARLEAAQRHVFGAIKPPAVLDRQSIQFDPGLYQNDILPDCTGAALANCAQARAALNGFALGITDDHVRAFYAACVGVSDDIVALTQTDGAVMMDVLDRQSKFGFEIGQQTALVGLSNTIDQKSRTALAESLNEFGGAYWGVTLRERDVEPGLDEWDLKPGRDDGQPIGGHCVMAWDYTGLSDDDTVRVATWGKWMPATWAWVSSRLEEAHVIRWKQLDPALTA